MKTSIYHRRLVLAASVLTLIWVFKPDTRAEGHPEGTSLPNSCTLMAMPPAERAIHLARLKLLERSATDLKMLPAGFSFTVDLAVMSSVDLEGWAANEEKCCSYLKIERQTGADQKHAVVHVLCPADLRNETAESFGLRAGK